MPQLCAAYMGTIDMESKDIFLGTVNTCVDAVSLTGSLYVVDLALNGHFIQFKIDTGVNLMVI